MDAGALTWVPLAGGVGLACPLLLLLGDRFEFPALEEDVIYDDVPCENLDSDQYGMKPPQMLPLSQLTPSPSPVHPLITKMAPCVAGASPIPGSWCPDEGAARWEG